MNKSIAIALLTTTLATPAWAAGKTGSIGINASIDTTLGIQGEFIIQQPVSIQVFLKSNSRSYYYGHPLGFYNYNYTALGVTGIYDLTKIISLANRKIHPYAGAGLFVVSAGNNRNTVTGTTTSSPSNGGVYITLGARYDFSPEIDFDASFNNLSGPTIGANLKF